MRPTPSWAFLPLRRKLLRVSAAYHCRRPPIVRDSTSENPLGGGSRSNNHCIHRLAECGSS